MDFQDFWLPALLNTFVVAIGVTLLACAFAWPTAWMLERTNIPGRKVLAKALAAPYALPPFLLAMGWILLANPTVGWLNSPARAWINIYSLSGLIFVEACCLYPIALVSFGAALRRWDPSLEEAARVSGARPWRIFFEITAPALKDVALAGALSVFLGTIASFGVPAMIGAPARIPVFTTGLYALLKSGSLLSLKEAFRWSIGSAIVIGATVLFVRRLRADTATSTGASVVSAQPLQLGTGRWVTSGILSVLAIVILGLPVGALIFASLQSDPSRFDLASLSLRAWHYVFVELKEFRSALSNSVRASTGAATAVTFVSFALVMNPRIRNGAWGRRIDSLASVFAALPGTAAALMLMIGIYRVPGGVFLARGLGIFILIFALKQFAVGYRAIFAARRQLNESLFEAARLSGATRRAMFVEIAWPLLKPALGAAFVLVLAPCLGELSMSVILAGPGTENLGTLLFQLQEYADRASAAVIGVCILFGVLACQGAASLARRLTA